MSTHARRGISLFEAVAALAIVGMTAVSALAAVGAEMRTAERARRALVVEALATQRLDYMSLLSDRELQSLPDSVARGTFEPPLAEYRWTASAAPSSAQAGVYAVHVNVEWKAGSYALHSYIYRRPPLAPRGAR